MFFRKLLFSTAIINATSGCVSYQAQQAATQTVNNTGIVLTQCGEKHHRTTVQCRYHRC
ncbi:putative lipoprotein [Vibrio parahaemolyticus 10290]|nr:putative lipoprotein [Vibrio parahaemolyticus 10290]